MFTAKWCSNCDVMKPMMKDFEDVEIIDIEESPEYVGKFTLMGLPTFIIENEDGFESLSGIQDKGSLEDFYGKS